MPPLLSLSSPLNETIYSLNQTSIDLRKAIMENMIKNPEMFSGGKEDVHKWLEDLETQFDTADIPDNNKFSIISYQLKGEALSWFKDNKQNILTWKNFVDEIKNAFTSSFEAELSFKKLESYYQGQNQSIRNYYTEMNKIFKEADSTMSEASKLKYLMAKMKASLQFEVRKKKPLSVTQFLEYAREVEALIELSNNTNYTQPTSTESSTITIPTRPYNDSHPTLSHTFRSHPNSRRFFNNNDYNSRFSQRPSMTWSSMSQTQQTPRFSHPNLHFNQQSQPPSSYYHNSSNQSRNDQKNNTPQREQYSINTQQRSNQQRNTVAAVNNHESLPTITCTHCGKTGHLASACPRF